jgi:hypothetical protein
LLSLGILIRVLLLLLLLRLLLRFVAGVMRGLRPPQAAGSRALGELVRDPVCNTFVSRDRAVHGRFEGKDALFCSPGCRDRAALTGRG